MDELSIVFHCPTSGQLNLYCLRYCEGSIAVRKTSIRMTAIKEYPFDLSDLKHQNSDTLPSKTTEHLSFDKDQRLTIRPSTPSADGKRKVSIMADEGSKDRENLPSER
ncbi:unnamed protein product [Euphydryas editha]|uniref:Uncharacterized protein n=1 Tax=Euphydryas editha TaxID=104508 RepID=A0AAU9V404_EUPED|nr:unnamed protein product [Euphydryas editha]